MHYGSIRTELPSRVPFWFLFSRAKFRIKCENNFFHLDLFICKSNVKGFVSYILVKIMLVHIYIVVSAKNK